MYVERWQQCLVWLLVLLHLAASQVPSAPAVNMTVTMTLTEALYPVFTTTVSDEQYSTTYTATFGQATKLSTTITASGAAATYSGLIYVGLDKSDVEVVPGYNISLGSTGDVVAYCYYPTSGQWSLLPRILFYITLVFALVWRKHEWLVGGALAAALAYSSLAAMQMSLQVWSQKDLAELDFLPMLGILGMSCVLAVPLMNWSSTIQRLGLGEDHTRSTANADSVEHGFQKKKDYGTARLVLVLWSLIVAVGFLAGFVGLIAPNSSFWPYNPVDVGVTGCVPPGGFLDATAGQLPEWQSFYLTSDFIAQNNCLNPCSIYNDQATLFRSPDELHLVSQEDVAHLLDVFEAITSQSRQNKTPSLSRTYQRNIKFVIFYYGFMIFLLPFIILQGVLHVTIFWRSTPQKARWKIYRRLLSLRDIRMDEDTKPSLWTRFAFSIAWVFYGFAILVLAIAPAVFLITLIATELVMSWIAQSETNSHLDQWGVFAITILVLIAAVISQVTPHARKEIKRVNLRNKIDFYNARWDDLQRCRSRPMNVMPRFQKLSVFRQLIIFGTLPFHRTKPTKDVAILELLKRLAKNLGFMITYEWHLTVEFWKHPHLKPARRQDTGAEWNTRSPEEVREEEQCRRIDLRAEAEQQQNQEREAKTAKEEFIKLWNQMAPVEAPSMPALVSTTDGIGKHLNAKTPTTTHQAISPWSQDDTFGLPAPISLPPLQVHRVQRSSKSPISSSIPLSASESTSHYLQPSSRPGDTQRSKTNSPRYKPEMTTVSSPTPAISRPIRTDAHSPYGPATPSIQANQQQARSKQLRTSTQSILEKSLPRLPTHQSEMQRLPGDRASEDVQQPSRPSPRTFAGSQLEARAGREGNKSRNTATASGIPTMDTIHPPTRSRAGAEHVPVDQAASPQPSELYAEDGRSTLRSSSGYQRIPPDLDKSDMPSRKEPRS